MYGCCVMHADTLTVIQMGGQDPFQPIRQISLEQLVSEGVELIQQTVGEGQYDGPPPTLEVTPT